MEREGQTNEAPESPTGSDGLNLYERLLLLVVGACLSGFLFGGIVGTDISSPTRVIFTEPTLCRAYLIKAKYRYVYGTYFEYWTVSYWPWGMWFLGAMTTPFITLRKMRQRSRTWPVQIFAGAAISMGLYYAIWWVTACAVGT